jgi:hypothetical protein
MATRSRKEIIAVPRADNPAWEIWNKLATAVKTPANLQKFQLTTWKCCVSIMHDWFVTNRILMAMKFTWSTADYYEVRDEVKKQRAAGIDVSKIVVSGSRPLPCDVRGMPTIMIDFLYWAGKDVEIICDGSATYRLSGPRVGCATAAIILGFGGAIINSAHISESHTGIGFHEIPTAKQDTRLLSTVPGFSLTLVTREDVPAGWPYDQHSAGWANNKISSPDLKSEEPQEEHKWAWSPFDDIQGAIRINLSAKDGDEPPEASFVKRQQDPSLHVLVKGDNQPRQHHS